MIVKRYFSPTTPPGTTPPTEPPATTPPGETPPGTTPPTEPPAEPPKGGDETAKWRRLHEQAAKEAADLKAKLKEKEDAELSESERNKKRADEAEQALKDAQAENLRLKIAGETGLAADMLEFLTATDEAGIRAQAEKLAAKMTASGTGTTGTTPPATPPAQAGTTTQPNRTAQPSLDERILAADKAGNAALSIELMRERAGLPS